MLFHVALNPNPDSNILSLLNHNRKETCFRQADLRKLNYLPPILSQNDCRFPVLELHDAFATFCRGT